MPTTTWQIMNGEIQRPLGWEDVTTTTNLAGNNSVISTQLADRWAQDDYFNGWYCIIRGTNNDEVIRRITDYAASSGTLTIAGAVLSSESGSVTIEVSRFHPDDVKRAYNRTRQNCFPNIAIVRDVETVVTGPRQITYTLPTSIRQVRGVQLGQRYNARSMAENLFLNSDFEDWTDATTADNWSIAGTGASVNQEKQTSPSSNYAVLSESNSARVVVPSSVVTTLLQTVDSTSSSYPAIAMEGMECNVSGWVYCTTPSRVSISIATDLGSTHGGTGWELIKHSFNLVATATSVAAGISVTSGAAIPVYVDEMICVVGPSEVLEHPYASLHNWEYMPPAAGASNGGTLRFSEHLPSHRRLRIIGLDMLSSVDADANTVEIDGELLEPLYNRVRNELCNERYEQTNDREWLERSREYDAKYQEAMEYVSLRLPPQRFKIPNLVQ